MQRSHLNLVLLVAVAGLGAGVWFSQKQEEKGPPLTALSPDAITRIKLEHPGKPTIELAKQNGQWMLTAPVQSATDKYEIGGILSLADLELKGRLDAASVDRKALELDPPRYRVTLDNTAIDLGGTEPIKYRRYVQSGTVLGLIDDPPSAALDADYSDLVSKALVPEGATLKRIELPGLVLDKNAQGQWSATPAEAGKPEPLAQLAESWRNARALWNAAEPPEGSSGDPVKLVLDDGRSIDLRVQARDPQLVLANPALHVHYTLSKALVDELFKVPADAAAAQAPGHVDAAPASAPANATPSPSPP